MRRRSFEDVRMSGEHRTIANVTDAIEAEAELRRARKVLIDRCGAASFSWGDFPLHVIDTEMAKRRAFWAGIVWA